VIGHRLSLDNLLRLNICISMHEMSRAYLYVGSASYYEGAVKVGASLNPAHRARYLKLDDIYTVEITSDCMAEAEAYAHLLLREYRIGREWFRCSKEVAISVVDAAAEKIKTGEGFRPEDLQVDEEWKRNGAWKIGVLASAQFRARRVVAGLAIAAPLWQDRPDLSVREIAKMSGLSVNTLYNHLGPRTLCDVDEK
jgi:hypothetical protein